MPVPLPSTCGSQLAGSCRREKGRRASWDGGGDHATGGVVEGEEKMIQRRPIQEGGKVVWRDGRSAVMSDLATLHAKKHPISNVLNALSARPDIFGSEENSG